MSKQSIRSLIVGMAMTLGIAGTAQAVATLDQQNLLVDNESASVFNGALSGIVWQQEIIAGLEGTLARVEFLANNNAGAVHFFLNRGSPWQGDANDFSTPVDVAASAVAQYYVGGGPWWIAVDVTAANFGVQPGDRFVIGIEGTPTGVGIYGTTDDQNTYPGSLLYQHTLTDGQVIGPVDMGMKDFGFRTYVNAVPEPAAYLMFLGGLGFVGLLGRRRRTL